LLRDLNNSKTSNSNTRDWELGTSNITSHNSLSNANFNTKSHKITIHWLSYSNSIQTFQNSTHTHIHNNHHY